MSRETIYKRWKLFRDRQFLGSVVLSLLMVLGSLIINFNAGVYATEKASNAVTDIILSNIPVYDVQYMFIYGPIILWAFVACVLLARPERIPFTLKAITIFVLIRALFITLTHLGPFPTEIDVTLEGIMGYFTVGGDLFFSAHTGAPFLLSLIFWQERILHYIFIISALIFGAVVLLGHLHYSIDVLAAFFITFSIYHLAVYCFPHEYALFKRERVV